MGNPLLNNQGQTPYQQPQMNLLDRIRSFGQTINGDPQQIVQNLMASGKMSRQQFEQYAQTANQILGRRG